MAAFFGVRPGARVCAVGLLALCQCSLMVSVDGLEEGSGPSDASSGAVDPAEVGGGGAKEDAKLDGPRGADGAIDTGGAHDASTKDAPAATDARDAATADTPDAARADGASDPTDGSSPDATDGSPADASDASSIDPSDASSVDASDASTLGAGLVVLYSFDETSGTTAHDSSGNGLSATLVGGASFAAGLSNNAVTLNGSGEYVALPSGIASSLHSFSACAWVFLNTAPDFIRVFDFGTGTNDYMFLSPHIPGTRFAITTSGQTHEQQTSASPLPTGLWQHVALTSSGSTATLYVNGAQVVQNTAATLSPADLGVTTQNWLGRSQYASDPFLSGQIDNFRLYSRALSASEIRQLFQLHE